VIRGVIYLLYGLLVMLLVRMITRAVARVFAGISTGPRPGARSRARAVEDLVRDTVCNTYIPRSRALTAVVSGHEAYFCSTACRDRALAAAPRAS